MPKYRIRLPEQQPKLTPCQIAVLVYLRDRGAERDITITVRLKKRNVVTPSLRALKKHGYVSANRSFTMWEATETGRRRAATLAVENQQMRGSGSRTGEGMEA